MASLTCWAIWLSTRILTYGATTSGRQWQDWDRLRIRIGDPFAILTEDPDEPT
jgi:hypothetical protein